MGERVGTTVLVPATPVVVVPAAVVVKPGEGQKRRGMSVGERRMKEKEEEVLKVMSGDIVE